MGVDTAINKLQLEATRPHRMHLLITSDGKNRATCTTCGHTADPSTILRHVKASRRWRYLGAEDHYGYRWLIWKHDLTGHRYAIRDREYAAATR